MITGYTLNIGQIIVTMMNFLVCLYILWKLEREKPNES